MSDTFFSGHWQGEYTYGHGYPKNYIGKSVSFDISMTLTDGVLKGTCTDDKEKVPVSKPAIMDGFIEGNFISFIKQYAHAWEIEADGTVIEHENQPSHEIHYTGTYDTDGFTGDWEIAMTYVYPNGVLQEYLVGGTWSMKRID